MAKLTNEEITLRLKDLEEWTYKENALERTFRFKDFREAFATMTHIAFACEAQNHHPDWSNVYNTLKIRLNTHDAAGVTEKDFELAATVDRIVGQ